MVVYCPTLANFSKPLLDFDKQVFCVTCEKWGFGTPGAPPPGGPGKAPWLP
jgi:hypothetical protein